MPYAGGVLSKQQIKRKARWALEMEDRHGEPGGLHYVWWGSALALVYIIETRIEPMRGAIESLDNLLGPPNWAWLVLGFLMVPGSLLLLANRHKPLGWSRTYRRLFRRGSFPHGVASWFRDATLIYLATFPLACVAVTVQN